MLAEGNHIYPIVKEDMLTFTEPLQAKTRVLSY